MCRCGKKMSTYDPYQYGLIGSTEWGEDFADWIDKHVVAYFNLGELLYSILTRPS